ncbi:MAG: ABC transporter substrate-binding protein [Bordetella sp.]|uniref:ABC transporter substrate-binding protein n=1 Tax=Bordetella sp. TaxID=28081 RepID=UPI003F7C8BA8
MNSKSSLFKRLLAASALAGAGIMTAHAAATLKAGDLQVGMEISYPPFESWDKGKVVGFDPELAQALAKAMGDKASFVDTKFTGLILGLGSEHFDVVISGMYVTPERQAQADALPYGKTGALILVRKGSAKLPKTEQDLCGMKVGLEQGTTWVKALQTLSAQTCVPAGKGAIAVSEFPSAPEASQALLSGNVDAQLEIAGAARMFAERTKDRLVISSPELVYPQTLGMYVKKGNTQLMDALKKAMATIRANGEYGKLLKKYNIAPVE